MRRALTLRALGQNPLLLAGGLLAVGLLAVVAGPHDRSSIHVVAEPAKHATLTVLAASHPVPAGSIIGSGDVEAIPATGPLPIDAALSGADVLGRVTGRSYAAREIISRDDLRDAATLGIAARVLPGQRAFSIHVAEDQIVGGFLQSGDHVDVFATIPGSVFPSKDSADVPDRSRTVLLLQDISVLAVGENPATQGSIQAGARTVSLSLAPDGLARLALAQRFGIVSLAIRRPGDNSAASPVSATLADLVPSVAPANPAPAPMRKESRGVPFYSGVHFTSLSGGGAQ